MIVKSAGLNAMFVDSSALTEQVINDLIISAFNSAGQCCSTLRIFCIWERGVAERTLTLLLKDTMGRIPHVDDPLPNWQPRYLATH
ncbi:MAG: hypothetical protein ACTS73_04410 [Arsenophonus sp. NEOnobi-MAG3]